MVSRDGTVSFVIIDADFGYVRACPEGERMTTQIAQPSLD